jgi:ppGpp synthetase/RelA/SpoT-type nucleotidyltranferase
MEPDKHYQGILDEYRKKQPLFERMQSLILKKIRTRLDESHILIAALESRIKTEESLAGKLVRKGYKYHSLSDVTDIVGIRIVTFYSNEVDFISAHVEQLLDIDWENSVDKRKLLEIDSFGYLSLHYICSTPSFPYRFEVQMRTLLQHAWANMDHDTGYKSGVEIPSRYLRSMSRMAGLLELVDEEFSKIHVELADYRRRVQALVASGNLSDVPLDGDSFRSYLELKPFDALNKRIAKMNQAEIQEVPLGQYLTVFKGLGFKNLGDIADLVKEYSEAAFQIACYQIGLTDLDIIASSLGPQDLCIAYVLKKGGGRVGLKYFFDLLNGQSESNASIADMLMEQAADLPFMNQ